MARRCPKCGERYDSELKRCPNCNARAKGGSRVQKNDKPWLGAVVVAVAVLCIAVAVFLVIKALQPSDGVKDNKKPSNDVVENVDPTPAGDDTQTDVPPSDSADETPPADVPDDETPPPEDVPEKKVDSIVLDTYELEMAEAGETAILAADIYPATAAALLKWSSEDENIVTVDGDGIVTAVAPGTTSVVARAGDKSATCIVTVLGEAEDGGEENGVPDVDIDSTVEIYNIYYKASSFPGEMSISYGETVQMCVDVDGVRAKEGIVWSSDDTSVATVDEKGVVKGVGGGVAEITATVGSKSVSCICRVR